MYSHYTPGFKWVHRTEPYGTHQPVLYEAIQRTKYGPIVELGCGYNSTDLIHSVAGERTVYTLDHDLQWLSLFTHRISDKRKLIHINSWSDIMSLFSGETDLSVVFVDQGSWESRADCLKFFKDRAKILVLHDSDYLEREGLIRFEDFFKFQKTFMPLEPYPYHTGPPTTVLSNVIDVTDWIINYEDYHD